MFPFFKKKVEAMNAEGSTHLTENSSPLPKNIVPVIQPFNWAGKEQSLKRSLCYMPRQEGTPWLSFAFDTGLGIRAYASEASLETWGVTAGELETIALQNLSDTPAQWQAIELAPKGAKSVKALLCHSEGFTAERILDSRFLQKVHDFLQDDMPVALIPGRSTLVVMPLSGDLPFRVAKQFYDNSDDALSDWVFCVSQGHIAGRVVLENGQIVVDAVM